MLSLECSTFSSLMDAKAFEQLLHLHWLSPGVKMMQGVTFLGLLALMLALLADRKALRC